MLEFEAQLREINRQFEIADDNENSIERTLKRGELMDVHDAIEAEVKEQPPSSDASTLKHFSTAPIYTLFSL